MISVKQTNLYPEVIKELNYPFVDLFIFNGFIVSEVKQDISFNWNDHGKLIVEDVSCYLGTYGKDVIYISNRVHSYSVVASDWLKFFKNNYFLKEYFIITENKKNLLSSKIENLFFKTKIKRFNTLYTAINWLQNDLTEIA